MKRDVLTAYLDEYLKAAKIPDACPNGLQVEGRSEIRKVITGVSACVELFEKAVEKKADAVIVHHGLIWDFARPVYKGGYKKRVKILLENDINLYSYHLPLDAHEELGNNILMAKILGLYDIEPFGEHKGMLIGFKGKLNSINSDIVYDSIKANINPDTLFYPFGPDKINTVGIISGGARNDVGQAVINGLDLFLTGEAGEHTLHYVKEEGIHYAAAGHHATERFGVRALGEHIRDKFNIDVEFIDIPNPV